MSEHDSAEPYVAAKTSPFTDSSFRNLVELVGKPGVLAWGSGSMVVILSLTLLILFTISKESGSDSDIAKSVENSPIVSNRDNDEPKDSVASNNENGNSLSRQPTRSADNDDSPGESTNRLRPGGRKFANTKSVTRARKNNVSLTRGSLAKCGIGRPFEMQLVPHETDLVLRWNSVPNAAKYHVYVSDDDEILVDEFVTESGTSYILKKPLDPKKSYKWKIVITLENGQTLNVDAQIFSSRDVQSDQKIRRSKVRLETRCLSFK